MISIIETYYENFELLIQLRKKFGNFSEVKKNVFPIQENRQRKMEIFLAYRLILKLILITLQIKMLTLL